MALFEQFCEEAPDYKTRLEEAKNNFQLSVFKLVRYMSIKNYNLCKKQT